MDKALLGLGRKNDKATKLHHTLQIDIYKEDCKSFDIFLAGYCFLSIAYKISIYSIDYDIMLNSQNFIITSILDVAGICIWLLGLTISIFSLMGYSLMKSKDIMKSAKRLLLFTSLFTAHFLFSSSLALYSTVSNSSKSFTMNSNEILMGFSLFLLVIFSEVFVTLYFYSQKIGLAGEIQGFDMNSSKQNAAFLRSSNIIDI